MYDDLQVFGSNGDSIAASNVLIAQNSNKVSVRVYKVVLIGDGSNALTLAIHDDENNSNSSLIKISMAANQEYSGQFRRQTVQDFNPPVVFNSGVSFNITGNGGTYYAYYTR